MEGSSLVEHDSGGIMEEEALSQLATPSLHTLSSSQVATPIMPASASASASASSCSLPISTPAPSRVSPVAHMSHSFEGFENDIQMVLQNLQLTQFSLQGWNIISRNRFDFHHQVSQSVSYLSLALLCH